MPLTITEEMVKEDPFYNLGYKKGQEEAKREDIKNLYEKLNLSPEKIADILDVSVDFVKKVIKESQPEK